MTGNSVVDRLTVLVTRHLAPESLTDAASRGDLEAIEAFLASGENIEERSVGFSSPLHAAAHAGRAESVDLLLARGARPEQKPGTPYSALSSVAMPGQWAIFRTLLDALRDVSEERIALTRCAAAGRLEEMKELIARGASKFGRYAIASAAQAGQYEIVRYLIDSGVEWKEFTALRIPENTRAAGFEELYKFLQGEPFDEAAAIRMGRETREKKAATLEEQLRVLAERRRPADPAERSRLVREAIDAIRAGGLAHVLEQPAVQADRFGEVTPLMAAALVGDVGLVTAVLDAGAKPGAKQRGGMNAKSFARGPHRAAIVTLIENAKKAPKRSGAKATKKAAT